MKTLRQLIAEVIKYPSESDYEHFSSFIISEGKYEENKHYLIDGTGIRWYRDSTHQEIIEAIRDLYDYYQREAYNRKNLVAMEVVQFNDYDYLIKNCIWFKKAILDNTIRASFGYNDEDEPVLVTESDTKGVMLANLGDYIILDSDNEIYFCKLHK